MAEAKISMTSCLLKTCLKINENNLVDKKKSIASFKVELADRQFCYLNLVK